MSSGLYSITTRASGTILTAAIYNADHQNHVTNQNPEMTGAYSDNVAQMQTQTNPGGVGTESLASALSGEIERIRYVLAQIMGTTYWYDYANQNIIPTGTTTPTARISAPSGWLLCDGSAVSRTTYAALFAVITLAAPVTISIASPAVITWNAHGLVAGDTISFETSGALPTGLSVGTLYYVISSGLTTNTFEVSASPGGSAVNTSGTQSGTQTARRVPYGCGDGSTTFNVPDLRGRIPAGFDSANATGRMNGAVSTVPSASVLGASGGEQTHTLTVAELATHSHNVTDPGHAHSTGMNFPVSVGLGAGAQQCVDGTGSAATSSNTSGISIQNNGSSAAHNNVQPTIIMNWIIKT